MSNLKLSGFRVRLQLQDNTGDAQSGGKNYDGKTYFGVTAHVEFDLPRDSQFPIEELFARIKKEIDAGRYFNCAWRKDNSTPYHAYVIYGYDGDELFAVSKDYGNPDVEYANDMGTRLRNIQGSDIITFTGA